MLMWPPVAATEPKRPYAGTEGESGDIRAVAWVPN